MGGPCPLEDSWLFKSSSSTWSKLPSCPVPAHSSSFVTLNRQLPDIGMLYGGTQKGPGIITQVKKQNCHYYYFSKCTDI